MATRKSATTKTTAKQYSNTTTRQAKAILSGKSKKGWLARLLPFLGLAFIASVAYMNPGNFATNIQGGVKFGYTPLWVIVLSNLMAMLLQLLSAKLGIATGHNLAEHCRNQFPRSVGYGMWVIGELVAMVTNLAEFLGAALVINLLFGLPLWVAGFVTAIITFVILGLERYGFRSLEIAITAFVGVVALSYLVETGLEFAQGRLNVPLIISHAFIPRLAGTESLLIATSILGATVMPHALYLHFALTQEREVTRDHKKQKLLFHFEIIDVLVAMGVVNFVNVAMLIKAASTFHQEGLTNVGSIQQAHITLEPLLGPAGSIVFAISLLASGLSSSSVGMMAGQVIMQGFLHRHIQPWIRRLVTILPSLIVILGFDPTRTLVISQVVLSFGLPIAIIPLVIFTSSKNIMGALVNRRLTTILASLAGLLIVSLNFFLPYQVFFG